MTTTAPRPRRSPRRRPRVRSVVAAIVAVLLLVVTGFAVYCNIVMPGDRAAALRVWRDDRVRVQDAGDSVVMTPTASANGVGLVFIPGAKVDPYAYLSTFRDVVAGGTTVVITKPTLNLAFFDTRPLSTFERHAPGITTWAVGGHSLGGVRACQLASTPGTSGLLLLGSYCVDDLSSSKVDVLSLSGTRDGLSTPADIRRYRSSLPASASMVAIPGASHAQFGAYGKQPGDLAPTASRDEVDGVITDEVNRWVTQLGS
ncbi:hypothetical protein AS850_07665 [Frondihabitans sp. 762G35]|uniref:alpha/beta hydrolase n=1 Tax=Frondihabitans sp. 762G35 TaxID=1446794 RepID=UPI000D20080F|nr:alpha/beta hydrolase [Frondihabitans sp. 762G35]ARC56954.1 hypothetical protein AS850_07665 [Frondihabitans sp. 762G35]